MNREKRIAMNISLAQIASHIGCSIETLVALEEGTLRYDRGIISAEYSLYLANAELAAVMNERFYTILALRELCGSVGDNDWEDTLFIPDIIEKHLADYLLEAGGTIDQLAAANERIERLEATLDGDPNMTESKETRLFWRASAIRYADKVEEELNAANKRIEKLEKAMNGFAESLNWWGTRSINHRINYEVFKELAQEMKDVLEDSDD